MFRRISPKLAAIPSLDSLDRVAVAYLTLPLCIFLYGWFNWWAALPLLLCTLFALKSLFAELPIDGPHPPVTRLQITVAVAAGCAWSILGGADHLLFANADWLTRDAVLHDLVLSPWPVGYGLLNGKESLLRAPVAFYLPAAIVGKWLGLSAAHVAMGLWTAIGASLFLVQVLSLTPSRAGVALAVTAVVILFSGLDIVGSLLDDGPRFRSDWNVTTHLEWWAHKYQYSSMTTQLFWVPNHALGGWLSVGLLCRNKRGRALNAALPLIVVAVALWSPLTALGLAPFVVLRAVTDKIGDRSMSLWYPVNWAPAFPVGVALSAYLILDPGGIPKGLSAGGPNAELVTDLLLQVQFFLLEAGLIGAAVLAIDRSSETALAMIILALLPLVRMGPGNDLVMRASIPSLVVLTIGSCTALLSPHQTGTSAKWKMLLGGLLLVGAVTPIDEFARAVLVPVWPINMSASLIDSDCGEFPPHYVARLDGEFIGRFLQKAHEVSPGPQGSKVCDNPAQDLLLR